MQSLKYVIIGVGAGVLHMHRSGLALEPVNLVAAYDRVPERGKPIAEELGCTYYDDYRAMLAQQEPDVAVILTSHPSHMEITLDCLAAGCHVIVEKPLAVQVAEADRMIAAAKKAQRHLSVAFQRRFNPEIQAARALIQQGELGSIQHVAMTCLWTRPALYFTQRPWRGTWRGEGGGVILNQASHNIDMLCYLLGMPSHVYAWTKAQLHHIEAEDTVQAMLRWEDGAMGSFHVSTAEMGPEDRLDIWGTHGYVQIIGREIHFHRVQPDMREYVQNADDPYKPPRTQRMDFDLPPTLGDHVSVYQDLHDAIFKGTPLKLDAASGLLPLEVSNAIILSGQTGREVSLPVDREEYAALLARLQGAE